MAVTTTPTSNPLAAGIVVDTAANGTAENDVRAGATTVYLVDIDNSANAAASYFKMYDAAAPTVGTTAPDIVIKVPASTRLPVSFAQGIAFTNLSFACVTTAGTAGTTNPTSSVTARIVCT